jgi:ribonuclease Z
MFKLNPFCLLNNRLNLDRISSFTTTGANSTITSLLSKQKQLSRIFIKRKEMLQCGVFSLEILGTGALGTTPSIVAISDNERLLFDCGDGTQRLCTEHGVRVSKITRVYLTRNNAFTNGGLGGFLLTRADLASGDKSTIVGPPGIGKTIRSFRHFFNRPNTLLSVFEVGCDQFPTTTLDGVSVIPVMVNATRCCKNEENREGKRGRRVSPSEIGRGFEIFETNFDGLDEHDTGFATSYIIKLPERRGRFRPDLAIAQGVKPGKDFGLLTRGESVTTAAGKLVKPEACMDKPELPPIALIVCCPSFAHLQQLAVHDDMLALQAKGQNEDQIKCIIHLAPAEVLNSPSYREWAGRFPESTDHIAVGEGVSPQHTMFPSSARLQCRLSVLDSVAFPFLEPVSAPTSQLHSEKWIHGDVKMRFTLAPSRVLGLDLSKINVPMDVKQELIAANELLQIDLNEQHDTGTSGSLSLLKVTEGNADLKEIVFLGTGSAIPSKYRNVSALMLIPNDTSGAIMLDCGEGTVQQLARTFGSIEIARNYVAGMGFVWISHMHADHHLGLLTLLAERTVNSHLPPLIVVGPTPLNNFLTEYSQSLGGVDGSKFSQSYIFLDCEAMTRKKQSDFEAPALRLLKENTYLQTAISVPVLHCYKAYGLVLQSNSGWKIVYSGDTEFCPDLVTEGRGADVLVHEATFEDGKEDEAKEKKHSTISQALRAGLEMNAKAVVFTHFSQRYPKNPPAPELASSDQKQSTCIVFAFDLMRFHPKRANSLARKSQLFGKLLCEEPEDEEL